MKLEESIKMRIKSWFSTMAVVLSRLLVKIMVVVIIGAIISFVIHYIKGYEIGSVMRIVGIIIAIIGLTSQLGGTNIRRDHYTTMARVTTPQLHEHEFDRDEKLSSNFSFLIWMGSAGVILYFMGEALM